MDRNKQTLQGVLKDFSKLEKERDKYHYEA